MPKQATDGGHKQPKSLAAPEEEGLEGHPAIAVYKFLPFSEV